MSASTHSPVLKHHFADLHQQHASERLGMWMFLATEILFFGGVFVAYTAYRMWNPVEFEVASSHLNRTFATINTVLLITSSLTMTLAIRSAKLGDRKGLFRNLLLTASLGAGFMVIKGFEYAEDFHEHYVPGELFQKEYARTAEVVAKLGPEEAEKFFNSHKAEYQEWAKDVALRAAAAEHPADPAKVQLFMCFYYIMTGIHGIHILVGIGCILWLVQQTAAHKIPPENYSTVEVVSLYWHLVDAIWLFLMPLLYLAGAGLHHH